MISWNKVKYFKSFEFDDPDFPGSGKDIDGVLLFQLEKLRKETGWPIIPHWRVGGCVDVLGNHGHATHSYHRLDMGAKACDFHFDTKASSRYQTFMVMKIGFGGIGIYQNQWYWNNAILSIGFHVDVRPSTKAQIWKRENGKYIYLLK